MNKLTPMLNTADFEVTLSWYKSVGFQVLKTNHDWAPEVPLNWCLLELSGNRLMLNLNPERVSRNLTLSLEVTGLDELFAGLSDEIVVHYPPQDQFYGRRDFEVRDPSDNGLLFGQPL